MSYCWICGKKLQRDGVWKYNPETGKPIYRYLCPDACKHGEHDWRVRDIGLFRLLFQRPEQCARCGILGEGY